MRKFYEKQPVLFAVVWIVIYVIGMSWLQDVSASLGIENLCEAVLCAVLAIVLIFIAKNFGGFDYYGLKKPEVSAGRMLIYLPLALVAFSRLIGGVGFVFDLVLLLRTVKMLFVGFIEEIIFRGLLFRGITKENNMKLAIIVSSLTFGAGHIVNLIFNGYTGLDSVLQIAFALVCGFMLAMVYVRTDSLIACIIFHSLNNMSTGYSDMHLIRVLGEDTSEIVWCCACILIMAAYTLYLTKVLPPRELSPECGEPPQALPQ